MPFGACVTGARRTTSAGVKVTAWVVSAICFILAHWTLPPVISGAPLVTTSSPGTSQRQSCWANCQSRTADDPELPFTMSAAASHESTRQESARRDRGGQPVLLLFHDGRHSHPRGAHSCDY